MNETLEAMARAIFKSWFVDFDPVRAKVEGRDPGLPNEIAALFHDRFQDSDVGEIPKGWEDSSLSEVVALIGGGTPKTKVQEYWGGDIPWFSVVDAPRETDVFVVDTEKHITQLGVDKSSTKVLRKGTTIISARGTVGKCALVGRPMAMNQSCYGIQGKGGTGDYFVYFTIRRQVADLQRSGHGSVFNTITRDTFKTIRIAFPPTNLTNSYEEILHPFMESILANLYESATLASLRDTLIPKLISGELRVPDAEKLVEASI
jgi:type I restriction enzyme S subunit